MVSQRDKELSSLKENLATLQQERDSAVKDKNVSSALATSYKKQIELAQNSNGATTTDAQKTINTLNDKLRASEVALATANSDLKHASEQKQAYDQAYNEWYGTAKQLEGDLETARIQIANMHTE